MSTYQMTYPMAPGGQVLLDLGGRGQVHVRGGGTEEATVTAAANSGQLHRYINVLKSGSHLRLEVEGGPGDMAVELKVPSRSDLQVDSGSNRLTVERVQGQIHLDTGSGPVTLLRLEGTLTLESGSGAIHLEGFRGDRLEVSAGSGQVRLLEVDARDLLLECGSGPVSLRYARLHPGACHQVSAASGPLEIILPHGAALRLRVLEYSPRVRVHAPHVQVVSDEEESEYLINHPGPDAPCLEIEPGSGSVTVAVQPAPVAARAESDPAPAPTVPAEVAAARDEELERVLRMVAEGKLSPEEGAALLEALEADQQGGDGL